MDQPIDQPIHFQGAKLNRPAKRGISFSSCNLTSSQSSTSCSLQEKSRSSAVTTVTAMTAVTASHGSRGHSMVWTIWTIWTPNLSNKSHAELAWIWLVAVLCSSNLPWNKQCTWSIPADDAVECCSFICMWHPALDDQPRIVTLTTCAQAFDACLFQGLSTGSLVTGCSTSPRASFGLRGLIRCSWSLMIN